MCRDFSSSLSCVRRAYLRRGNRRSLLLPSNAASSPQSAKERRGLHSVFLPREIISCPSLDETCISSFFRPLILYLWCITHGEDTSSTKTRNCWLCQTDIITDDIHLVANTCALRVLPALTSIISCPSQIASSLGRNIRPSSWTTAKTIARSDGAAELMHGLPLQLLEIF